MPPKSGTKLFKLVCKQSELMRAPFRDSSWTNKTAQTDKKTSIINKGGAKFRLKVAKLSIGKTWSEIQKEWVIVNNIELYNKRTQCLCGRANLKYVTYLKNIKTNHVIVSGNCCLLTLKN